MDDIQMELNENGRGAFFMNEGGQRVAEMVFSISGNNLTVYHTEVSDTLKGKGVSGRLLETMVNYVRSHSLRVIPLCPYVNLQFRRHAEQYKDIWNKDWHA
jgi:predicted GNAT family acetyltransferase